MVAPMLVVVLVFMGGPAVWTFILSFTNMTVTGPTATHYQFIGFANYKQLFSTGSWLLDSVGKSIYYLVVSGYLGQAVLGFLLAYFLSRSAYACPRHGRRHRHRRMADPRDRDVLHAALSS